MRSIGLGGVFIAIIASCSITVTASAAPPQRIGPGAAPIATSVAVPGNARIVYVSGTVPDPANAAAPEGSVARYGDTETQTRSVLAKIDSALGAQGLSLGDVVMMRVFLTAAPGQARMDFSGMMRAFRERFGTPSQPAKPARSTVQVAGLADPGFLVEIEVTAAGDQR